MIALVAMVPAWEQRAAGGDHGDGHAYCPVHANPAVLEQALFLLVVLPAHAQALASDRDHLPAPGHSIFVPPRI